MRKFSKENSIRNITAKIGKTSFQKYKYLTTGDVSLFAFLLAEFITCVFGPMPGALGIFLRRKTYSLLFKKCGKGIIIGSNCVFRHPAKIKIGDNVIIDDNCLIDARGAHKKGVTLENGVIINRGTTIKAKSGDILIGKSVTIGANSSLISWDGIEIGEGCAIAPVCYISAGKYDTGNIQKPILSQETYCTGPIIIGKNVWVATRVTILDGVRIGHDSIVSAAAVITQAMPPRSIISGNPAKVLFTRR
jgi:acetyltransferase-like isoleucine patch superfamily enzyme